LAANPQPQRDSEVSYVTPEDATADLAAAWKDYLEAPPNEKDTLGLKFGQLGRELRDEPGLGFLAVVKQSGCNVSTVYWWMRKAGWRRKKRPSWPASRRKDVPRLNSEELSECRKDPAWEARRDLTDRVICRKCGAILKSNTSGIANKHTGHVWRRHRTTLRKYKAAYPGAPLWTLEYYASKWGSNLQDLVANRVNAYLGPELEACRKNPSWERDHGIVDGIYCRECGLRLTTFVRFPWLHLGEHGLKVKDYLAKYPGAPWWTKEDYQEQRRKALRKRKNAEYAADPEKFLRRSRTRYAARHPRKYRPYARLAEAAAVTPARQKGEDKPEMPAVGRRGHKIGTILGLTYQRLVLAWHYRQSGTTPYAMAGDVFPYENADDADQARKNTYNLLQRHRTEMEALGKRLTAMSEGERLAEITAATNAVHGAGVIWKRVGKKTRRPPPSNVR
jgi:hypothetical protein